jgi:hypothetical protein
LRIIPQHAAIILGMVKVPALVKKLGRLAQHQIPVREAWGHVHLPLILSGKYPAFPLPKSRGTESDVYHDIKYLSVDDAAYLGLRMLYLIVKSSERVFDGTCVIVLNKTVLYAKLGELDFMIALEEEPSFIF